MLDWVKVGAVGGQEDEPGTRSCDGVACCLGLVAAEIVHHDDVSGFEAGNQDLLDVSQEAFAIDRAIEDTRCCHLINPQRGEEGQCDPVAVWNALFQSLAPPAPAAQGCHVGLDPSLVNEDQPRGFNEGLDSLPPAAFAGNVRPRGFFGVQAFF